MEKQQATRLEDLSDVLSVKDIRNYLGIGQNTAYKLIMTGEIESFQIGTLRKIKKQALIKYLDKVDGQGS